MQRHTLIAILLAALFAAPALGAECNDGIDNDLDGYVDEGDDPGCDSRQDTDERCDDDDEEPAVGWCDGIFHRWKEGCAFECLTCDDGLDNDDDLYADLADDGCLDDIFAGDETRACQDGIDNDNDELVDLDDPGCDSLADDDNEKTPGLICDDGIDQDNDGEIDLEGDPGCATIYDTSERSPFLGCDNGYDDDGDGKRDQWDPGCHWGPHNYSELSDCHDGVDNDGDNRADQYDPGCAGITWAKGKQHRENPQCDDGIDNDGDGLTDAGEDPSCYALTWPAGGGGLVMNPGRYWQSNEGARLWYGSKGGCGMGFEAAPFLVGIYLLRRRRRRLKSSSVTTVAALVLAVVASAAPLEAQARTLSATGVQWASATNVWLTAPAAAWDEARGLGDWPIYTPPRPARLALLPISAPVRVVAQIVRGFAWDGLALGTASIFLGGGPEGGVTPSDPDPRHVWVIESSVRPTCSWAWADQAPRCLER